MVGNTKGLFFLCVFLFLTVPSLNAQWIDIASPVTTTLRDVYFADSLNGWAVGDTSTIIHTSDGGYNWVTQTCPVNNINLNKIQFVTKDIGFIVANNGIVLKTINGGDIWNNIVLDTLVNYVGLIFVSIDTGWIAGSGIGLINHGVILKTTDGGFIWVKQYDSDSIQTSNSYDKRFQDLKFINTEIGYAFAGIDGTFLFTTTNGGKEWNKRGFSFYPLFHIDVVSKDTVWGCGGGFASTVDDGLNWIYNGVLGGRVSDLKLINYNTGYILADRFEEKKMMFTTDRGQSFTDTWIYQGSTLLAMHINNDINFICAVGTSGRIVINKSFITGILDPNPAKINGYNLYQNYPNPFNSTTSIRYQIHSDTYNKPVFVMIDIYDMLGNKVKSVVRDYKSPGTYEFFFDASSLCSGAYLYLLRVGDNFQIQKMILLK